MVLSFDSLQFDSASLLGASFSWLDLFLQAHIIVKIVMIGLMTISVWSWAVIIEKHYFIRRVSRSTIRFEKEFWSGRSLDDLYKGFIHKSAEGSLAIFVAAMREWKRSSVKEGTISPGLQLRIERVMNVTIAREVEHFEERLLFLATVGSVAPFIGLFGTVWGVMDSFQAIAGSGDTNLATVAPGIAEALFATALGLVAAIPAVVFYNKFSNQVMRYALRLERFSEEFLAIFSRHVDERV